MARPRPLAGNQRSSDLTAFGNEVGALLLDPSLASRLGAAAERRVRERYLAPEYLGAYLQLIAELA